MFISVVKSDTETEELALAITRIFYETLLKEQSVRNICREGKSERNSKRKPRKTRFSIREYERDLLPRWSFHDSKSDNGCGSPTGVS